MTDTAHAARRTPTPPEGPVSLASLGDDLIAQANELAAGRAARTLTPGAGAHLKETILAVAAGNRLQEHRAPGAATIQVLRGEVELGTTDSQLHLTAGQWAPIPDEIHDLVAVTDAAILLTVATPA